jgi:hypothetical protein
VAFCRDRSSLLESYLDSSSGAVKIGILIPPVDFVVSNSKARIEKYQRQASEHLAMAEQAGNELARKHHSCLAESYRQLVEMELRRMEIRARIKPKAGKPPN